MSGKFIELAEVALQEWRKVATGSLDKPCEDSIYLGLCLIGMTIQLSRA